MEDSHHAKLIQTEDVKSVSLEGERLDFGESVDLYFLKFGIDDAKDLLRIAHTTSSNGVKLVIVRAEFITHEAQNALLKVLEEPPTSTRFFFILPSDFCLLDTLKSRFSSSNSSSKSLNNENLEFTEFLQADFKDRLALIDKSNKSKNVDWQMKLKKGLIHHIRGLSSEDEQFKELEYVARTLLTRGASNKMLLEHVALIIKG